MESYDNGHVSNNNIEIDEGDLDRLEGVGRVLDHLGRLDVGFDEGCLAEVEHAVDGAIASRALSDSMPKTTLSGYMKPYAAEPSRRN